jgi:hypothetical protein
MSYLLLLGCFVGIRDSFHENMGQLGVKGGVGTGCFSRFIRETFLRHSTKDSFCFSSFDLGVSTGKPTVFP